MKAGICPSENRAFGELCNIEILPANTECVLQWYDSLTVVYGTVHFV